jgi:hypothetical protein
MFPIFVFFLAVVFLALKFSGALDEFAKTMRDRGDRQAKRSLERLIEPPEVEVIDERLEVYRKFFERPLDEENDS